MNKLFSVKLLFESIVTPKPATGKTFEESIILIKVPNEDEIEQMIFAYYLVEQFTNATGGKTTIKLVRILDIFEVVDNIYISANFVEVYSRYLLFEEDIETEELIKLFQLDK
ncbi:DUF4288 domain-containing protein [Lysinibacillus cavernae]|uniref:DUF4288 domain-containing protein n=1 Tax=Lysinibacillus cavernae TaxID=2666135 RepID=UPI0012D85B12|nr:DUF4288 domain-containing protein [Lysinibacillus cavernae]